MKSLNLLIGIVSFVISLPLSAQENKPPAAPKPAETRPYQDVGPDQFDKLRKEKNTVVLDVRTKKEFEAGHIAGAVNIDWNASDFEKKAAALDKNKIYLVHCQGGVRSSKACDKLGTLKFPKLFNLEGGLKAWEKAGKPVEK
ncbi:MAG: rhodanese-like domain-containing protein [Verrucomicrobia bacterium]|nr:MAG: rhodanese-like domain-containing protein [Verrucomicrobiota bacterium]